MRPEADRPQTLEIEKTERQRERLQTIERSKKERQRERLDNRKIAKMRLR